MLNRTKIVLTVAFIITFCYLFTSEYSSADSSKSYKSDINYVYMIKEKTLRFSGSGVIDDYEPDSVPWKKYSFVEKIVIEDGIERIGNCAFYNFSNVTNLIIPNSVKSIGNYAFHGMTKMTSFPISSNIEYGEGVFSSTGITEVTLDCNVSEDMFAGCNSLKSVLFTDRVSSIGAFAFFGCRSLKSINIPDTTLSIGKEAFRFCTALSSVKLPNTMSDLDTGVFAECESLVSITLPNNIKVLNAELFRDTDLTSISIPKSVELIGNNAFLRCYLLKDIVFLSSDVPKLEEGAFKLTEIDSETVATIHSSGWANDNIFTSFVKGDKVSFNYKPIEICINDMVTTVGTKTILNVVPEGMSISVTGADWIESKGNTICGTPTVPGDYNITLACGRISKTFKIRVVPPLDIISDDKSLKSQSNNFEIVTVKNVDQSIFKFSASVDGTWDFGDGTVSNDRCVEHTFSESGLHQIKFIHSNGVQYATALVIDKSPTTSVATGSLYVYCPGIDYPVTTNCPGLSWDDKTLSLKGYPSSPGEYTITVGGTSYKLNVTTGPRQINHDFEIITDGPNVTVKAASAGTPGITYWWKIVNLSGKIVAEGITEEQKFTFNEPGNYVCTCIMTDSSLKQSCYSKAFSVVTSTQSDMASDNNKLNEADFGEKRIDIHVCIQSTHIWVCVIIIFTIIAFIIMIRRFCE